AASGTATLSVGLGNTAGAQSGSVIVGLTSNGSGTSGLGTTSLSGQTINVSGTGYRLASASAHTPEPVAFGYVHVGGTASQNLTLQNTAANDGFSEKLDGSIGSTTGDALVSGSFSLLSAQGSSSALNISVDASTI